MSTPEIGKLIGMSELFQVSLDYLLKDYITERTIAGTGNEEAIRQDESREEEHRRIEQKVDSLTRYLKGYQYTSKTKIAGIPLVSIRLSRRLGEDSVAKGIIAIGNVALGLISLGAISVGVISFGAIAFGILAIAAMAVGVISWGALAVGVFACGSGAIGIYSMGVGVFGKELAVGVSAVGKTAIGETARGEHCLIWHEGLKEFEIREFLNVNCPNLWKPLKDIFVLMGEHVR